MSIFPSSTFQLDKDVTGPLPEPRKDDEMILFHKGRKDASRNDAGTWEYVVDRSVLISTSQLFLGQFHEKIEEIMVIWPESCTVSVYFDWLYTRTVKRISDTDRAKYQQIARSVLHYPKESLKRYAPVVKDIHLLISLWIFGSFIKDPTFCDTVIDMLNTILNMSFDHSHDYNDGKLARDTFIAFLNVSVIEGIWSRTAPGAKLRAFVIDRILMDGTAEDFKRFNRFCGESNVDADFDSADEHYAVVKRLTLYLSQFVKELNDARGCIIHVSQLPGDIQHLYYQEHVFVPLPPYAPEVIGRVPTELTPQVSPYPPYNEFVPKPPQPAMSLGELSVVERENFFRAVYGTGVTILRPAHLVANKNRSNELTGMVTRGPHVEIQQANPSCAYHEHVGSATCYLRSQRFERCQPVQEKSS